MSDYQLNEIRRLSYIIQDKLISADSFDEGYDNILRYINENNIIISCIFDNRINQELNISHYEWRSEKPPLNWYSLCLTCYFIFKIMPFDKLILLMKSANYYGNYRLVIDIFKNDKKIRQPVKDQCRYYKEVAKAYKNMGRFEDSRIIYREILDLTFQEHKNTYHSYYLMLYAKLCNDYQQRQALYIGLHKIAYSRIRQHNKRCNINKRFDNWEYISKDSYAKSIFFEDRELSTKYYNELLSCDVISQDSLIRIKSHFYELSILRIIKGGCFSMSDTEMVLLNYNNYKTLLDDIKVRDNDRASNVRNIQYLRLSRSIIEWARVNNIAVGTEFNDLMRGEAIALSKLISNSSNRYNDWKTSVYAMMEIPYWLHITTNHEKNDDEYEESIECLNKAKNILTCKYKSYLSEAYYDVLTLLAENYINIKDWGNASNAYKEIYEYSKIIFNIVKQDEMLIDIALKGESIKHLNSVNILPEFKTLNYSELNEIKKRLAIDYKYLCDRILFMSDRLYSLRMAQIAYSTQKTVQTTTSFKYHALSEELRKLSDETNHLPIINERIKKFNTFLKRWSKEEQYIYEILEIDLKKELSLAIKENLTIEPNKIIIPKLIDLP